ncbi:SMP-30/gluconolactonase/LRE family protein [Gimesia panareensis]|uniref:Gluconolactonase n=1 Tax=Gimesia panareensis TaxID=2527978 RepID=A0A518AB21_9PLAN|nr:SMP-30/gluconolactonase/LRE family protein [Gimesia panareensis]QDT29077.1 Gluconolactonase precursor [Gimesia panareensis]QDU51929.1 Gluconolactonase precursor [Gimesia panareensis]
MKNILNWSAALLALIVVSAPLQAADQIPGIGPVSKPVKVFTDFKFTEGPAFDLKGNLYFTDIPDNKIYKVDTKGKLSVFLEPSNHCNGLMLDGSGKLLACEMDGRLVSINLKNKKVKPLAAEYKGKRFNAPNDLVVDRTGGIYFTDPHFRAPEPLPQGKVAVYYRSADGKVTRLIDDLKAPNGVILSPDEKTLYVIPSMQKEMWAYPVTAPGKIGKGRVFCTLKQAEGYKEPGSGGDGLTIDTNGNLYITTGLGLQVYSPEGKLLGIIEVPEKPANVTFGGKDNSSLFITARTSLYRIDTKAKGHRFPGKSS